MERRGGGRRGGKGREEVGRGWGREICPSTFRVLPPPMHPLSPRSRYGTYVFVHSYESHGAHKQDNKQMSEGCNQNIKWHTLTISLFSNVAVALQLNANYQKIEHTYCFGFARFRITNTTLFFSFVARFNRNDFIRRCPPVSVHRVCNQTS